MGALVAAFGFAAVAVAVTMLWTERTDAQSTLGISLATAWGDLGAMPARGGVVTGRFALPVATAFLALTAVFPVLGHAIRHADRGDRPEVLRARRLT